MWQVASKQDDNHWEPYIATGDGTRLSSCEIDPAATYCVAGGTDWYPNDPYGDLAPGYLDAQGLSTNSLVVGLRCRPNSPNHICGNGYSITEAEAAIYSAFLTISDPTAPAVGTPTGEGWTTAQWAEATLPLALSSSDNTGISATRVYADGQLIASLPRGCSYDRPRPCTDEPVGEVGLPTAVLPDGTHTVEVAAVDAAGNETRVVRPQLLLTDNHAPDPPAGVASPSSTSATNDFSVTWALPPDAGTPIVAARYQLCGGTTCAAARDAPSPTRVDGIVLPGAGTYSVRVWLVDQLGHADPAGAATVGLSYQPLGTPHDLAGAILTSTPPPMQATPVPTPTIPRPRYAARLGPTTVIRRVGCVRVTGSVSRQASGRLTLIYRGRIGGSSHRLTQRVTIHAGRYAACLRLSPALAAARTATITLRYAGDPDTRPATATTTLTRVRGRQAYRLSAGLP